VVEDDADLRSVMRDALEAEGCEVVLAADGRQALDQLRGGGRPCVVLLDLMMPSMDGWQFMEEVRLHPGLARIPIVVVSAYGSADGVRSVGAADYLRKPFQIETVMSLVARHCRAASGP
jgi:two-component system response regulator MprA